MFALSTQCAIESETDRDANPRPPLINTMFRKEHRMTPRVLPQQSDLLQLLRYESETGKLFWRERPVSMFKSGKRQQSNAAKWNTHMAGTEVGPMKGPDGYFRLGVGIRKMLVHRVIFKMVTGEEPQLIDHIDGNRANNRWENLRSVNPTESMKNLRVAKNNATGVIGVHRHPNGSWIARIQVNRVHIHLGYFDTFDEAVAARKAAEIEHSFHPNHGRAATGEL